MPAPQDQFNRRAERSIAENDVPRVLSLSYTYQLPVGHGRSFLKGGIAGRVLEGFSVADIQSYQAGTPISISAPANDLPIFNGALHLSRGQGPFTTGNRRNISIGNSLYGTSGTTYLNQAAFALPASVVIPDPSNPSNTIANPAVVANPYSALGNLKYVLPNVRKLGFFSENISVSKSQTFEGRYSLQIGADLINAFNRRNFAGLNTNFGSPGFGQYGSSASGPRIIQLTSKVTF